MIQLERNLFLISAKKLLKTALDFIEMFPESSRLSTERLNTSNLLKLLSDSC